MNPKSRKIIQLASYEGNIGDNANVIGTRRMLKKNLGMPLEFTDLEFEHFGKDPRWACRAFDDDFVKEVNRHDLFIIGGGGFFGLTVDYTCTGTPIDIPIDVLKKIKVPVVFYALGFHTINGYSKARAQTFKTYLDYLLSADSILVSVRNDGSLDNIRALYGEAYAARIFVCPDGGFFTETPQMKHIELASHSKTIALQLGGDSLFRRFYPRQHPEKPTSYLDRISLSVEYRLWKHHLKRKTDRFSLFIQNLSSVFQKLMDQDEHLNLVLVPHIPKDLFVIDRFLETIGHYYARNRSTVAPFLHGQKGHDYLFDLYQQCDLVAGMRFHSNVCNIGLNIPTIGLVTYSQISGLYEDLGVPERMIRFDDPAFTKHLENLILDSLNNKAEIKENYSSIREKLEGEVASFHTVIKGQL